YFKRHSADGQWLLASRSPLWALFHEVLGRQARCIERSLAAATTQPANATHSISQPLPNRSCIDHAVRAGGATGKNSRYTPSISALFAMAASTTSSRRTRSSDYPADSPMCPPIVYFN